MKHRSNQKKSARKDQAARPPARGKNSSQTDPVRRWLFRLAAGLILPLFLLVAVEISLRIVGFGYPTGFFRPMRIGGRDMLVENGRFGFRFFPPEIARTPASLRMPARKPPGTYRIFIFGESAALGDPEPAYGAGRYLEVLLREKFPAMKFEVINVAMTAINSHVILPIARDCARREGDLWIIYMGNNEMVGPFGAATVFGSQAPPWRLVRLNLAIQQSRLGQFLAALGRKWHRDDARQNTWSGMNVFTGNQVGPDDPRRREVYENFDRNLRDILVAGRDSGAQVLLSTVAVNLRDCPPFASQVSTNLSGADREAMLELLAEGNALADRGDFEKALKLYGQADQFKPQLAELDFRLAGCLLPLSNNIAARAHFQSAVDLDWLPFRADSSINSLIAKAGRELASPRLTLVDAPAILSAANLGIPGQDFFYEHVHLNFDGNYRLARAWAEQIARLLPVESGRGGTNWAAQENCERQLGLTDWDRCNVLAEVCRRLQQPPLNGQSNNAVRLQILAHQLADLRQRRDTGDRQSTEQIYREALKKAPEDFYLHENLAYFLADTGDIAGAIKEWEKVRDLIPQDHAAYYELGRLAGRQGQFTSAMNLLNQAVAIHPSFAPGWFELGRAHAASGDYEHAIQAFARSLKFDAGNAQCWFCEGLALAMLDRRADAIEAYRQAVKFAPDDWQAHFELGGLLGLDGNMPAARDESEAAVRLNPNFPTAHLNLGMALVQLGQLDAAKQQFEETLRLDPTNSKAADYLAQTRTLRQKQR